ncbi:MAG TPA: ABC transporter permease [Gemmatimonadales bacterium]|jgi:predicted permease
MKGPLSFKFPWRSRRQIAAEIEAELAFHLAMRTSELEGRGMTPDAAAAQARTEFGDVEFTRAYCRTQDEAGERSMRWSDRLEGVWYDVRHAVRSLRRTPAFTGIAIFTITLVLGANTAVFSAARAVLLRPLPYGHPDALVAVQIKSVAGYFVGTEGLSPPDYQDYRAQQHSFTDIAAYNGDNSATATWLPTHGDPEVIRTALVTGNMFTVLGATPRAGRALIPGDAAAGAPDVAVVSSPFFDRALGGDPARLGESLIIDGRPTRIVGVMRPEFTLGHHADIWLPLDLSGDLADPGRTRKQHWLNVVGRLRPGTTIDGASRDLSLIGARLAAAYPDADSNHYATPVPLRTWMVGSVGSGLTLLQGSALLVLLIACANLANLTLSRALDRRRDVAVRAALGSGRGRLIRQLLFESILVAVVGGILGIALAYAATRWLLAINANFLPGPYPVAVDGTALAFCAALALGTGFLSGLAPALTVARLDLQQTLREGGRGSSGGRVVERARRALVVAQIALAATLLIGAGLLVRSFRALDAVQLGFAPDHVLTARFSVGGTRYDTAAVVNRFYDQVIGELARTPGVVAVGASDALPTQGSSGSSMRIEGQVNDEANLPNMAYLAIRGDYFQALRVPLLAGRLFTVNDNDSAAAKVAVINEAALHKYFPNGAIGKRIHIGPTATGPAITIVGIIADVHGEGASYPVLPTLFTYHRQQTWESSLSIAIRTRGDPLALTPALRRAVRDADPRVAIHDIATLETVVRESLASRRFALALVTSFAALALVLATVGIYGVLAYLVAGRRREFGVRLALGATRRSVVTLVLRQGLIWTAIGLALGLAGAAAERKLLTTSLYGVSADDPMTWIGVAVVLFAVVTAACLIPAIRATRVDPVVAMRAD